MGDGRDRSPLAQREDWSQDNPILEEEEMSILRWIVAGPTDGMAK
jgi:hypothetical protein